MKKYSIVVFLFTLSPHLLSQVIKIKSGVSRSNLKSSVVPILDRSIFVYDGSIGIEYAENRNTLINTELGYSLIGGKEKNPLLAGRDREFKKAWSSLYFLTTFRYKIAIRDVILFVGAGPQLNYILQNKNHFENTLYADSTYDIQKFNLGFVPEIGFTKDLSNFRYSLGISYHMGISKLGSTEFNRLYSNAFKIGLSIGSIK